MNGIIHLNFLIKNHHACKGDAAATPADKSTLLKVKIY